MVVLIQNKMRYQKERFFVKKEVWRLRWRFRLAIILLLAVLLWLLRVPSLRFISSVLTAEYMGLPTEAIVIEAWLAVTFDDADSVASIYDNQLIYVILNEEDELVTDFGFKLDREEVSINNLVQAGIKEEHIIIVMTPERADLPGQTSNHAHNLRKQLEEDGIQSYTLASVWYHSRRSCLTYRNVFAQSNSKQVQIDCYPLPKEYGPDEWWHYRSGMIDVAIESLKFGYYMLRGFR